MDDQPVIVLIRPRCSDCGGGEARVFSHHYFERRTGPQVRLIFLCASCEYGRDHPEALTEVKPPHKQSLRLQTERLFEV